MLAVIGENPDHPGLLDTPLRAANVMMFFS